MLKVEYGKTGWGVFILLAIMTLASCGGRGLMGEDQEPKNLQSGSGVSEATGILVHASEIAKLPDWQLRKLSDPGWNQPYIGPRLQTEMPEPTWEMLDEFINSLQTAGADRLTRRTILRQASWLPGGTFGPYPAVLGQYDNVAPAGVPSFGCNSIGDNEYEGHALEDVIIEGNPTLPHVYDTVMQGGSYANHFNTTGGHGNSARSAVFQLFCANRNDAPEDWEYSGADFEELTYRADLAPGIGPGGDCSAAEAYLVGGAIWKRFNSRVSPLPEDDSCYGYDILIAPSSAESVLLTSSGFTDGRFQEFYCGNLSACYGGGWIVGLESSTSGCADFNLKLQEVFDRGDPFYTSPIYGVLLKRWQQSELAGMAGAWEGHLGWPALGPMPFKNCQPTLTPTGIYYAWGMWFERGFIWWVDYDQEQYPESPDEAQVYVFTGTNVFCPSWGDYEEVAPAVYYGGDAVWPAPMGEPRVAVVVDSYRTLPTVSWTPCELNEFNEYEIGLVNDGQATVNVAMHAHAFGGTPNPDCSYDYYVWAFRDGTIFMGDEGAAQYVTHSYGSPVRNMESVYTVRVQVTDSTGAIGYGDSLPIRVGHRRWAWQMGLVRNDNHIYDANYDAIYSDLEQLGASFNAIDYGPTTADDIRAHRYEAVIWYRGGPGAPDEPVDTREWTTEEIDSLISILEDGNEVLLVSQDHGYNSEVHRGYGWHYYYGWDENELSQSIPVGEERFLWALGMTEAAGIGISGKYGYLKSSPRNLPVSGPVSGKFASDGYDNDGANAAERYNGSGSSGDIPVEISFGEPRQLVGYGMCSPIQQNVFAPSFAAGVNFSEPFEGGWDIAFFSGGVTSGPYHNVGLWPEQYDFTDNGKGKLWWIGYPWAQVEVTDSATGDMVGQDERHKLLHNILGWLDDGLSIGSL